MMAKSRYSTHDFGYAPTEHTRSLGGDEEELLVQSSGWALLAGMFPKGLEGAVILGALRRGSFANLPAGELADLLGRCLWDVLSNNHEVRTADGTVVDFGSFRAAAGLIADFRGQRRAPGQRTSDAWGYLDFYMGTLGAHREDDLSPFYDLVFSRMRGAGFDWRYAHPRLLLVDLGDRDDDLRDDEPAAFLHYDPSGSVAREAELKQHAAELADLRASLDEAYQRSVEEARAHPPPPIVQSYQRIYGCWPAGWPPA